MHPFQIELSSKSSRVREVKALSPYRLPQGYADPRFEYETERRGGSVTIEHCSFGRERKTFAQSRYTVRQFVIPFDRTRLSFACT